MNLMLSLFSILTGFSKFEFKIQMNVMKAHLARADPCTIWKNDTDSDNITSIYNFRSCLLECANNETCEACYWNHGQCFICQYGVILTLKQSESGLPTGLKTNVEDGPMCPVLELKFPLTSPTRTTQFFSNMVSHSSKISMETTVPSTSTNPVSNLDLHMTKTTVLTTSNTRTPEKRLQSTVLSSTTSQASGSHSTLAVPTTSSASSRLTFPTELIPTTPTASSLSSNSDLISTITSGSSYPKSSTSSSVSSFTTDDVSSAPPIAITTISPDSSSSSSSPSSTNPNLGSDVSTQPADTLSSSTSLLSKTKTPQATNTVSSPSSSSITDLLSTLTTVTNKFSPVISTKQTSSVASSASSSASTTTTIKKTTTKKPSTTTTRKTTKLPSTKSPNCPINYFLTKRGNISLCLGFEYSSNLGEINQILGLDYCKKAGGFISGPDTIEERSWLFDHSVVTFMNFYVKNDAFGLWVDGKRISGCSGSAARSNPHCQGIKAFSFSDSTLKNREGYIFFKSQPDGFTTNQNCLMLMVKSDGVDDPNTQAGKLDDSQCEGSSGWASKSRAIVCAILV